MIRNTFRVNKCASCEPCDEYRSISELSNPYYFSFGKIDRGHMHTGDFTYMHNKVNMDYLFRK